MEPNSNEFIDIISTVDGIFKSVKTADFNKMIHNADLNAPELLSIRIHRVLRRIPDDSLSQLYLLCIFILYCTFSTAIFVWSEARNHNMKQEAYRRKFADFRSNITRNICEKLNIRECGGIKLDDVLDHYDSFLFKNNFYFRQEMDPWPWTLWNTFGFVMTTFYTIGDGKMVPRTSFGQILCCILPLMGIPLCVMISMYLGKALHHLFFWIYQKYSSIHSNQSINSTSNTRSENIVASPIHSEGATVLKVNARLYRIQKMNIMPTPPVRAPQEELEQKIFVLPIKVTFTILYLYIFAGAMILSFQTKWYYITSAYYIHTSLMTIGFGDLDAWVKFSLAVTDCVQIYHYLYGLFGYSLISMLLESIRGFLSDNFKAGMRKIVSEFPLQEIQRQHYDDIVRIE